MGWRRGTALVGLPVALPALALAARLAAAAQAAQPGFERGLLWQFSTGG